jgi:GT2 family glycosyltransferase|tara:strand:- start:363 stop:1694 length:1332 start_codon:yes stop_codon:yes gene_type:complete
MTQETLQERIGQIMQKTDNQMTSAVILSFNRKDDLEANINSLYEQTNLPFEVVIWDNASDPETVDYLKSIEGKTKEDGNGLVRVFYSDTNLGCSRGRREAIRQTKGNWIYTADNDMTYTPDWLEAIIDRVEQDPNIGAANSKIVYPNGKIQLNGGVLILEDNYFGSFIEIDAGKDRFDPKLMGEMDCDYLCGGATLVKREVADQVEHDPEYLTGFEDYDYSFQISGLGYRVVNCPGSTLIHHHIMFDEDKQLNETSYIEARWNARRTLASMIHFLERTGINNVKPTLLYGWGAVDGRKPFLKMGLVGGVQFEYEDLFPGRAFSGLTNDELRTQFDSMVAKNQEIRSIIQDSQLNGHRLYQSSNEIIEPLAGDIDAAFSRYNLAQLTGHLNWVVEQRKNGNSRLPKTEVTYLVDQFRALVVEADPTKAQTVYDKLTEGFSRLIV